MPRLHVDQSTRAVVTGAGSGLGRAFAKAIAAKGAVVVVADRREEPVHETEREITASGAPAVRPLGREARAPCSAFALSPLPPCR